MNNSSTRLAPAAPLNPPGWPVFLDRGIAPADVARFRRVVAAVWPRFADPALATYVRRVELLRAGPPEWSGFPGRIFAGFHDGRRALTFAWDPCAELPDVALATLVAHELAHCLFFAFGAPCMAADDGAVDELLVRTGFDVRLLDSLVGWLPGERSGGLAKGEGPWRPVRL